jgi:hemerythrin-like metal-binding protein
MDNTTSPVSCDTPCPAVDREHDIIVKAMAGLYAAVLEHRSSDVIGPLIDLVVRFCTEHFSHEEGLMRECGYAHADSHASAHQFLMGQILDLKKRCLRDELPSAVDVMRLLRGLSEHCDIWDRQAVHAIQESIRDRRRNERAELALAALAS